MTDMTDDPTQDPTVLASAYLDGEVTPDERALVESSPELLTEVEQLRVVRSIVAGNTEPAPLSAREAHLAAALDVFDQLGATPSGAAPAASLGARRARRDRRRGERKPGERSKLLLGTAAGLVVLAGAGAVIRGVIVGSNADDDSFDVAEEAPVEEPAEAPLGPAESDVFTELEGGNTNDELRTDIDAGEVAQDVSAESAPAAVEESEAADEAFDEPAEEPAEESAEDSVGDDPADGDSAEGDDASSPEDAPPEVDVVELLTPQDLADLAAPAAYAPTPAGSDPVDLEAPFSDCFAEPPAGLGIDRLAEPAFVAGELVNVGADLDTGLAYAFRDDCSIVLDALLPSEDDFLAGQSDVTATTAVP